MSRHHYTVIAADPPWHFSDRLPGGGRGAVKHYDCLSLWNIADFLVDHRVDVAQNAVLFLWRVAAMQEEACQVAQRWGFEVKAEIVWRKLTPTGKVHFGMGHYTRGAHESCLIAVRGKKPAVAKNVRSVFDAPVGRHSEKPGEFFRLVEAMYPGRREKRLEIFARARRPGWDAIGNELPALPAPSGRG